MEPTQLHTLGDENLYDFLVNAPKTFRENERIKKFQLKNGDYIHCVLWNYHFYITGTDIVKILIWRFQNAGKQIGAIKKFEEGIFSDLRNLKPGVDATLENPRSNFLEFLYKNGCIRTQKKQKVFYWYSVPHDVLFCDAMERDLRRDTNIYTYNTFVHDPRQLNPSDRLIRTQNQQFPGNSGPFNFTKPQAPLSSKFGNNLFNTNQESQKRGLFNINDTLFGTSLNENPKDDYLFIPPPKYQPTTNTASVGQMFGLKNVLFSSSQNYQMPYKEPARDSKPINQSAQVEQKFDLNDFDLEQFGFLKERLGFGNDNCELKLFKEDKKEEKSSSLDRGEVRFLGTKNKGQID